MAFFVKRGRRFRGRQGMKGIPKEHEFDAHARLRRATEFMEKTEDNLEKGKCAAALGMYSFGLLDLGHAQAHQSESELGDNPDVDLREGVESLRRRASSLEDAIQQDCMPRPRRKGM